nr:MAG TPA: hypothetical protein [Caudoviricetes sp.]
MRSTVTSVTSRSAVDPITRTMICGEKSRSVSRFWGKYPSTTTGLRISWSSQGMAEKVCDKSARKDRSAAANIISTTSLLLHQTFCFMFQALRKRFGNHLFNEFVTTILREHLRNGDFLQMHNRIAAGPDTGKYLSLVLKAPGKNLRLPALCLHPNLTLSGSCCFGHARRAMPELHQRNPSAFADNLSGRRVRAELLHPERPLHIRGPDRVILRDRFRGRSLTPVNRTVGCQRERLLQTARYPLQVHPGMLKGIIVDRNVELRFHRAFLSALITMSPSSSLTCFTTNITLSIVNTSSTAGARISEEST